MFFRFPPVNSYPDRIFPGAIKIRYQKMRELGNNKKMAFYQKLIGKEVGLLIEGTRSRYTGHLKEITSNYVPEWVAGLGRNLHWLDTA